MTVVCSDRRLILKSLLKGAGSLALLGAIPGQTLASSYLKRHALELKGERTLAFYNRHTGERQQTTYWINGQYQPQAITELSHLLRDHRQNEAIDMDNQLFDLLHDLQSRLQTHKEIHIISAYRSPKTNAMLAARNGGVARKSYHMKGMAMDIAIPGVELKQLHQASLSLKAGGVGYYPRSGFIHVDTGRVRFW